MNQKVINNPRIIKGVLTECLQTGGLFYIENDERPKVFFFGPAVDGKVDYTILVPGFELDQEYLAVSFWMDDLYYKTDLKKYSNGQYLPPNEMVVINRRLRTRLDADAPSRLHRFTQYCR